MWIKIVVFIFLVLIFGSLGHALYRLARERDSSDALRVVKSLTWRIGLSLLLFLLLIISYLQGWIHPHAI